MQLTYLAYSAKYNYITMFSSIHKSRVLCDSELSTVLSAECWPIYQLSHCYINFGNLHVAVANQSMNWRRYTKLSGLHINASILSSYLGTETVIHQHEETFWNNWNKQAATSRKSVYWVIMNYDHITHKIVEPSRPTYCNDHFFPNTFQSTCV